MIKHKRRIFLAGPAAHADEREHLDRIACIFEAGGEAVYLSHRDRSGDGDPDAAWRHDIEILQNECDALVVDLHGRALDENALYLAGLAYAIGLAVVLYKVDHRSVFYGSENSMVLGLSPDFRLVKRLGALPAAVERARRLTGKTAAH